MLPYMPQKAVASSTVRENLFLNTTLPRGPETREHPQAGASVWLGTVSEREKAQGDCCRQRRARWDGPQEER